MTKELKITESKFNHSTNALEESRQAGFVFTNPDYNTTVGYEVKLDQDTNEPYAVMYYNNIKCDIYGTAFNRFRVANWRLAPIVWAIAVKTIYDNPTIHPNKMAEYIHHLAQLTELTSIPVI
jgi:hypothetical protein